MSDDGRSLVAGAKFLSLASGMASYDARLAVLPSAFLYAVCREHGQHDRSALCPNAVGMANVTVLPYVPMP